MTDMLDNCFPGTRGEEMVGEIHSKVVKRSKSIRAMTARRRNTMSSINTFPLSRSGMETASGLEEGETLLMTKGPWRAVHAYRFQCGITPKCGYQG